MWAAGDVFKSPFCFEIKKFLTAVARSIVTVNNVWNAMSGKSCFQTFYNRFTALTCQWQYFGVAGIRIDYYEVFFLVDLTEIGANHLPWTSWNWVRL